MIDGRVYEISKIVAQREEGNFVADKVRYYADGWKTEIDGLRGNAKADEVARCFHRGTADLLTRYRFENLPNLQLDGVIGG